MSPDDLADLELDPAAVRAAGEAALDRIVAHLAAVGDAPSVGPLDDPAACHALAEPAPEHGAPIEALLDEVFARVPRAYTTNGPGYLAFVPGGGVFPAAIADFVAGATNRFTGVWAAAPALVQLEADALDWLRVAMGFPAGAAGLFTPGGSTATWNAILCARERHLGPELRRGTMYVTDQAHHSVVKSAKLAGIYPDRVRVVDTDAALRMRPDALDAAIAADRAAGFAPFLVVSSAGTTNTGAVDPLDAIGDVAARAGIWHHVDGAYGAFFHLVPSLRPTLAGLSRADSLTLDPHKGLFLPYGTGALLVRDGAALRAVHAAGASYLPDAQTAAYDPAQHGPDLSRGFPGLRVWMALKTYGFARYRAALAEKHALAGWAAGEVARIPGIVLDHPPALSLFAFHVADPGGLAAENAATAARLAAVNARGRVMLTGATVRGRHVGRVCVLSFRTRRAHVAAAVADLASATIGP